jgi:predicted metal-dependent hydrolase
MKSIKKFLAENDNLIHATMQKISSHVQRRKGEWVFNTVLIEGHEVPFKYKRQKDYKSLQGASVDMIYYPDKETIAGMEFEYMKVVKINIS